MKHEPDDPWCECTKCNSYICAYCAGDLNGFDSPDGDEVLCQECYLTKESGDYDDWEFIEDPN